MPAVTRVWAGSAQRDWSKGQHWNIRKWSWCILPSPIHHPQTSQLPGWSPPPSAGRHRPPGPGSHKVGAGTGSAEAPCAAGREAPRELRRAGGCTGSCRKTRPPPRQCGRLTRAAASPAREAPARGPRLSSTSLPRRQQAAPAWRGRKPRHFPVPAPAAPEGACSPARVPPSAPPSPGPRGRGAAANSDPPRAGENQPGAGPPPLPPPRGQRGQEGQPGGPRPRKHTHFHIAALVLKALDAVVLQAGVLGHGCARLRRRLLLRLRRRRRVSTREGEVGEDRRGREGEGERRARSVTPPSARWQQRRGRCRLSAGRGGVGRGQRSGAARARGGWGHVTEGGQWPGRSPGWMCPVILGLTPAPSTRPSHNL